MDVISDPGQQGFKGNGIQGSTFPGAQGHMPLDFAVGP